MVLTERASKLVSSVNSSVNRKIRSRDEPGRADIWRVASDEGDCEDFALTKRAALIDAGFPTSAVLIAIARTSQGVLHAVLIVRTNGGDIVLDNRVRTIRPWNPASYRWLKVQSPTDPRIWLAMR